MDIKQIQENLILRFKDVDDWDERYKIIIDFGKALSPFPEENKTDKNKLDGCQSQVWITAEFKDGRVYFEADSDAMIVKGLAGLILNVYSGQTPQDILQNPPDFINKIGIDSHLSPTRKNGLGAMIKQIQMYALAFKALANR